MNRHLCLYMIVLSALLSSSCLDEAVPSLSGDVGTEDMSVQMDIGLPEDVGVDASPPDLSVEIDAEWTDTGKDNTPWAHTECTSRAKFNLLNSFGVDLNDFPIRLVIPSPQNTGLSDDSVRFFAQNMPIPHELEVNNSDGAAFWVKLNIPEGSQMIWMYYGCQKPSDLLTGVWAAYKAVYHFENLTLNSAASGLLSCSAASNCDVAPGVGIGNGYTPKADKILTETDLGSSQTTSFTVSLWYMRQDNEVEGTLFSAADASCDVLSIKHEKEKIIFYGKKPSECDLMIVKEIAVSDFNTFHHIVFSVDQNGSAIWFDGVQFGDRKTLGLFPKQLFFGSNSDEEDVFEGVIDEVQIINDLPTAGMVLAHLKNLKPSNSEWIAFDAASIQSRP